MAECAPGPVSDVLAPPLCAVAGTLPLYDGAIPVVRFAIVAIVPLLTAVSIVYIDNPFLATTELGKGNFQLS